MTTVLQQSYHNYLFSKRAWRLQIPRDDVPAYCPTICLQHTQSENVEHRHYRRDRNRSDEHDDCWLCCRRTFSPSCDQIDHLADYTSRPALLSRHRVIFAAFL